MDDGLERLLLSRLHPSDLLLFVDGDSPVTLKEIRNAPVHPLRDTLPRFDGVLVLAGGGRAAEEFRELGAHAVWWGYCAVDTDFWQPVDPAPELESDLLFVGNRLPDRDGRIQEFFLRSAALCPERRFLLTGMGWQDLALPANVRWSGHLSVEELRRAYASARLVLNVNREPMARYGYSPASRLFEAAACGACIVSDIWPGIKAIFIPGEEILLARGAEDVIAAISETGPARRAAVGAAARRRVESDYTCAKWVRSLLECAHRGESEVPTRVAAFGETNSWR